MNEWLSLRSMPALIRILGAETLQRARRCPSAISPTRQVHPVRDRIEQRRWRPRAIRPCRSRRRESSRCRPAGEDRRRLSSHRRAMLTRRLGTAIISHTCSRTRQLSLTSYDRLFPNQDTMPKDDRKYPHPVTATATGCWPPQTSLRGYAWRYEMSTAENTPTRSSRATATTDPQETVLEART